MPTLNPILIAPTLLDSTMTSENDRTPWFFMSCTTRVRSIRIWPGLVSIIVSSGITFSSIAAEAVTTLKVDPGSYKSCTARLRRSSSCELAIRVRVERRLVGERENLARVRVHDDRGAARRVVRQHAGVQLALGDVLQVLVDRQLERRSGGRQARDARAERVLPRVGLNQHRAGLAANLRVVRRLDAAQPDVVDADVSEQMRAASSVFG